MRFKITFFSLLLLLTGIVLFIEHCQPDQESRTLKMQGSNTYVGDLQCKSCHSTQYNDWLKSDHFKAMEVPTDSTVMGNFNNAKYNADGVQSTFFKKNGRFFINTQGTDGNNHDFEVKYTFGHFPLQQYLVEFPGGRLQATRLSWDSRDKKWFHQYPGQKIDYRDWLHWTGNAQNWNTMCAECHSTDLKKNYNIDSDTYHTTYSVINVSCEACHGPGKNHLDYINSDAYKAGNKIPHAYIELTGESSPLHQINTCAPCHAVKGNISADKIQSEELLDNYIPVIPATERFYADGQMNEEDYNYAPFLQSKMFRRGVSCSNCHNPHSGKILYVDNRLCLQCHNKSYDSPGHTFHAENTTAASCKSCHMPAKTYMGNDLRHDHSFRVPRPDLSVKYGVPNTCNSCHKDKPVKWAADAVNKWYGPVRQYHFAEDLIPGSRLDNTSEAHLTKLIADTAVADIIKATAVRYLGSIPTASSFNSILSCLSHSDPQVRYEALRSLASFSPDQYIDRVAPLLTDKVRAVRIAAADLFSNVPKEHIPVDYYNAFTQANAELVKYLLYQADFAHGNISIADYFMKTNDQQNAEKFYLRAIQKDSLANLPRFNLSRLYNAQGRNKEALQLLETAAKTDNQNPQAFYDLALLYHEMNNPVVALQNFQKAYALNMQDSRLFYNYGLLLQQTGKSQQAIQILEKGLRLDPRSTSLNYAITYVYLQNKQPQKAKQYALVLKQLDPNNPEYLPLFTTLGIR